MVIVNVEIVPGSEVREAMEHMLDLGRKLGVMVTSNFNGFEVIAHPNNNAGELVNQYYAWAAEKSKQCRATTTNEATNAT